MKHVLNVNASHIGILAGLLFVMITAGLGSVYAQDKAPDASLKDPESLVRDLYDQVTFPPGKTPDWNYVRTMFLKESTIVMRVGMDKTAALTLDGTL
jgi:hypothetical protein